MEDKVLEILYREAQQSCGLSVGDYVLVKSEHPFMDNIDRWQSLFPWKLNLLHVFVGHHFKIDAISDSGVTLQSSLFGDETFIFPYFLLEKVDMYAINQERFSDLAVDDIVKVRVSDNDAFVFPQQWDDTCLFSEFVNHPGRVTAITPDRGICVYFNNPSSRYLYLPYFYLCKDDVPQDAYSHDLFLPYEHVLVSRKGSEITWRPSFFEEICRYKDSVSYRVMGISVPFDLCVPFHGNEHLAFTLPS